MAHGLDKCVSKFSDGVIKGSAAAGEPSSKPQDWSGQWRLPSNACCFIGCCKAVLMSPQCQSFSKFGSYSKYISLSSTFIKWNFTAIFWYVVVHAFTHTVETLYSTIYYSKYFIELHIDKSTQYMYVVHWTHKRHSIPRPFGRAMECLLWVLQHKLIVL